MKPLLDVLGAASGGEEAFSSAAEDIDPVQAALDHLCVHALAAMR